MDLPGIVICEPPFTRDDFSTQLSHKVSLYGAGQAGFCKDFVAVEENDSPFSRGWGVVLALWGDCRTLDVNPF